MAEHSPYNALRLTAYIIEMATALGESKRLCTDIYTEMDDSRKLFALFGVRVPHRVTKTEEVYFSKLKEPIQELAVQCTNILRSHEDAVELAPYIMHTELAIDMNKETLDRALDLVASFPSVFGLDENNIPTKQAKTSNCTLKAFEQFKLARLNYLFVDTMKEFWETPTPRPSTRIPDFGLRAKSTQFAANIRSTHNILLAF